MSKRRRKKRKPTAKGKEPPRSLSRRLAEVQQLIDQDRWVDVAQELQTLARRYPTYLPVWRDKLERLGQH